MTESPGEEFKIKATPSQELLRKLAYLAVQGNGSVLIGDLKSDQRFGGTKSREADSFMEMIQLLNRQDQARLFNERLDALDRASLEAMHEAEERLAEIRLRANRTKDGRLAFEDHDGKIRDERGNEISAEEIDRNTWNPHAATWSEFQEAQRRLDDAAEFQRRVQEQKERLGDDPNDDDLTDIGKEIDQLEKTMPASVKRVYRAPDGTDQSMTTDEATASPRATSAAKSYAAEAPLGNATGLQRSFAGAATEPDATTEQGQEIAPRPGVALTPN